MGGVSSGGDGTDFPDASLGNGGTGSNGGTGGRGGSGGAGGDGGTAGSEAGEGGAAGTAGGNGGTGGSPDPGELMTDPSFESGPGGWVAFGDTALLTRVQTAAHSGNSSLLSSSRDNYWNGIGVDIRARVAAAPDAQYIFSAYVRLAGWGPDAGAPAAPPELALTLKTRCPGQTDEGSNFDALATAPLTDGWTLLTAPTTMPRHCSAPLDYRIYIAQPYQTPAPWPDFYVDDVSLKLAEQ